MGESESAELKEYVGFIWIGEEPGVRLSLYARSPSEARAMAIAEYGEGHVISLRNLADAARPRGISLWQYSQLRQTSETSAAESRDPSS